MNKYIFTALLCALAAVFYGIIGAFLCVVPAFVCVHLINTIVTRFKHVLLLQEYANMTENIYVVAVFEFDPTIKTRAQQHRKLLHESGNNTGIVVHELYFGYAEHCNEDFEEYQQRVQAFIAEDRIKRHKQLSKHQDFYLKHTLKQQF